MHIYINIYTYICIFLAKLAVHTFDQRKENCKRQRHDDNFKIIL